MTTFCSGHTSSPIPGTADSVILTSGVIQSILDATDLAWLSPWVGYITSVITLDVPTYCSLDPPADPGLNAADLLAIISLGPGPLTQAPIAKLTQLIERVAWPLFCKCDVVSTPAITAPSPPADLPAVNPAGTGDGSVAAPCAVFLSGPVFKTSPPSTQSLIPNNGPTGSLNDDLMFPGGATNVRIITTLTAAAGSSGHAPILVTFYATNKGSLGALGGNAQFGYNETIAHTTTTDVTLTAPIGGIQVTGGLQATLTTNELNVRVEVYCGGPPGSLTSPCCPPDPILTGKLDQVMALLTLIQRQAAPFAYITGAVHSALSGTGTFSIGSILGLLLNVSVPSRAGREAGTPITVFDCGWLNFATADGYTERFFVSSDSQVIIPKLPGIYTDIGYSFPADVTVTITEITREP